MCKLAILSNINLNMLIRDLKKDMDVFETEGYGEWATYALGANDELKDYSPDVIFVIIDGNALLENCVQDETSEIERALGIIAQMRKVYSKAEFYISDIDLLMSRIIEADAEKSEYAWMEQWEKGIADIRKECNRYHLFDLHKIIAEYGRKNMYSAQLWYMGSMPYTILAISIFAKVISSIVNKMNAPRKKVLILDLDNTLWGGVVGEDGAQGITLGYSGQGACYRDAQKRILEIKRTGILLAVVSKNNEDDVNTVFEKNNNMILKKSDFVTTRINWNSKADNIYEISQELNITTSDFVFLDDNPIEREEVSKRIPDITIAEYPSDIAKLPETIESLYNDFFYISRMTDEDYSKTEMYIQESERKISLRKAMDSESISMDDYLRSLHIRILVKEYSEAVAERTIQLMNKTNQFNTNTLRMNQTQIEKYINNGGHILTFHVTDRYGDNGMVSIINLRYEKKIAIIDNFLMSCRVMGRHIEDCILSFVERMLAAQGIYRIYSSYEKTSKNYPVHDIWEKSGFSSCTESDSEYEELSNLIDVEEDNDDNNKKYYFSIIVGSNIEQPLFDVNWEN